MTRRNKPTRVTFERVTIGLFRVAFDGVDAGLQIVCYDKVARHYGVFNPVTNDLRKAGSLANAKHLARITLINTGEKSDANSL